MRRKPLGVGGGIVQHLAGPGQRVGAEAQGQPGQPPHPLHPRQHPGRQVRADHRGQQGQVRCGQGRGVDRADRLDLAALTGQVGGEGLDHRADLGIQREAGLVDPEADLQPLERCRRGLGCDRPLGDDREQQAKVAGRAGHGADDIEVAGGVAAGRRRDVADLRDQAPGRLVRQDSAERGRHAQRAADVRAELQRRDPDRQRRGRAAGGAARAAGHIPRITGGPVDIVEALPVAGHHRHVGLAPGNGARGPDPRHRLGVVRRAPEQALQPRRGRQAIDIEGVLDGHGQAGERPEGLPGRALIVHPLGAFAGGGKVRGHHGVEAALDGLVAGDGGIQKLGCADPLGREGLQLADGVERKDVAHRASQ